MPTTANGREYPAAGERKPNRKKQKRLLARIKAWEALPTSLRGKEFGYTKPGSNNKS